MEGMSCDGPWIDITTAWPILVHEIEVEITTMAHWTRKEAIVMHVLDKCAPVNVRELSRHLFTHAIVLDGVVTALARPSIKMIQPVDRGRYQLTTRGKELLPRCLVDREVKTRKIHVYQCAISGHVWTRAPFKANDLLPNPIGNTPVLSRETRPVLSSFKRSDLNTIARTRASDQEVRAWSLLGTRVMYKQVDIAWRVEAGRFLPDIRNDLGTGASEAATACLQAMIDAGEIPAAYHDALHGSPGTGDRMPVASIASLPGATIIAPASFSSTITRMAGATAANGGWVLDHLNLFAEARVDIASCNRAIVSSAMKRDLSMEASMLLFTGTQPSATSHPYCYFTRHQAGSNGSPTGTMVRPVILDGLVRSGPVACHVAHDAEPDHPLVDILVPHVSEALTMTLELDLTSRMATMPHASEISVTVEGGVAGSRMVNKGRLQGLQESFIQGESMPESTALARWFKAIFSLATELGTLFPRAWLATWTGITRHAVLAFLTHYVLDHVGLDAFVSWLRYQEASIGLPTTPADSVDAFDDGLTSLLLYLHPRANLDTGVLEFISTHRPLVLLEKCREWLADPVVFGSSPASRAVAVMESIAPLDGVIQKYRRKGRKIRDLAGDVVAKAAMAILQYGRMQDFSRIVAAAGSCKHLSSCESFHPLLVECFLATTEVMGTGEPSFDWLGRFVAGVTALDLELEEDDVMACVRFPIVTSEDTLERLDRNIDAFTARCPGKWQPWLASIKNRTMHETNLLLGRTRKGREKRGGVQRS